MAKSKPVRAPATVFEERLEAQRMRIFQARAIVEVVRKGLDEEGEVDDDRQEQPFWWSLTAASELLSDIANQLERSALSPREEVTP